MLEDLLKVSPHILLLTTVAWPSWAGSSLSLVVHTCLDRFLLTLAPEARKSEL